MLYGANVIHCIWYMTGIHVHVIECASLKINKWLKSVMVSAWTYGSFILFMSTIVLTNICWWVLYCTWCCMKFDMFLLCASFIYSLGLEECFCDGYNLNVFYHWALYL